jgi:UDP-3-O-[3-hydroxymyristoyl] N-acetylglucosamine deacetylase
MNHAILVKLFEDPSSFEIVESPAFRKVGQVDKGGIAAAAAFGPDVS